MGGGVTVKNQEVKKAREAKQTNLRNVHVKWAPKAVL